jgi:hypothetical protein
LEDDVSLLFELGIIKNCDGILDNISNKERYFTDQMAGVNTTTKRSKIKIEMLYGN